VHKDCRNVNLHHIHYYPVNKDKKALINNSHWSACLYETDFDIL